MVWYDDPITVIAVAVVIIFAVGVVIYAMRRMGSKPQPKKSKKTAEDPNLDYSGLPFKISKSVQSTTAVNAKDELRMLDLEREILSDAIRRLYEGAGQGMVGQSHR